MKNSVAPHCLWDESPLALLVLADHSRNRKKEASQP